MTALSYNSLHVKWKHYGNIGRLQPSSVVSEEMLETCSEPREKMAEKTRA